MGNMNSTPQTPQQALNWFQRMMEAPLTPPPRNMNGQAGMDYQNGQAGQSGMNGMNYQNGQNSLYGSQTDSAYGRYGSQADSAYGRYGQAGMNYQNGQANQSWTKNGQKITYGYLDAVDSNNYVCRPAPAQQNGFYVIDMSDYLTMANRMAHQPGRMVTMKLQVDGQPMMVAAMLGQEPGEFMVPASISKSTLKQICLLPGRTVVYLAMQ